MSRASLKNENNNPFVYLETASGSTVVGVDASGADDIVKIITATIPNLDPTSAAGSISIQTTTPGDIQFRPKGIGQSTFVNGNVEILGDAGSDGNLLIQNTTASGISGVIEYGGDRFIHNYGTGSTFVGHKAGNTSSATFFNTGVGFNSLQSLTAGSSNTAIGNNSGFAMQTATDNTAIGDSTLASAASGTGNTAVGTSSLTSLNGQDFNTAVGYNSLHNLTSGERNIAMGLTSGSQYSTNESSNIVIGNIGTALESNVIRIGTQGAGAGQQDTCFIAGINGTSVTAAGSVVVSSSGQLGSSSAMPTTWNDVTGTSASMAVNNGYVADNAGLVTLTLPATAAFGSRIEIVGKGTGGWLIAQNALQTIHFESLSTSVGVPGSLASTVRYDCIELICVTVDTEFVVKSSVGNITVV